MKTNAYKVVVGVRDDMSGLNPAGDKIVNVNAFSAMDAHKEVQDGINWKFQEIKEVYFNESELVYSLDKGFIEQ